LSRRNRVRAVEENCEDYISENGMFRNLECKGIGCNAGDWKKPRMADIGMDTRVRGKTYEDIGKVNRKIQIIHR
jgi:hypothetical protein